MTLPARRPQPRTWLVHRLDENRDPRARGLLDGVYVGTIDDTTYIDEAAKLAATLLFERTTCARIAVLAIGTDQERGVYRAFGTPSYKRGRLGNIRFSIQPQIPVRIQEKKS